MIPAQNRCHKVLRESSEPGRSKMALKRSARAARMLMPIKKMLVRRAIVKTIPMFLLQDFEHIRGVGRWMLLHVATVDEVKAPLR